MESLEPLQASVPAGDCHSSKTGEVFMSRWNVIVFNVLDIQLNYNFGQGVSSKMLRDTTTWDVGTFFFLLLGGAADLFSPPL